MGLNHKVPFRSEETLAAIAARCWTTGRKKGAFAFDVVSFINDALIARGIDTVVRTHGRMKGKLALKFFDREFPQDDPAHVEFAPNQKDNYVTLHVDNAIWKLAAAGDSSAWEILAHEIGHILLHDHYANAFSSDGTDSRTFEGTGKEDFAEWQAITFSGHLLIPTNIAQKFTEKNILAAVTNTPYKLALERLAAVKAMKKPIGLNYDGEACKNCYNFTVIRNGCATKCDVCGNVERERW